MIKLLHNWYLRHFSAPGTIEFAIVLVCSGLNLPMLLECSFNRENSIDDIRVALKNAYESGMTMLDNNSFNNVEGEDDDCIL